MKTQKKIIALSVIVAAALFSGCSSDDDASSPSPTYSNAAWQSVISYVYDNVTGEKHVENNTTITYDENNKKSEQVSKYYDYESMEYDHDNNSSTPDIFISYYKVNIETCHFTTDENGRELTSVCDSVYKLSIDGAPEKTWRELSKHEQSAFTLYNKKRNEKTFAYNDDGLILEETTKKTVWNSDANQTSKQINGTTVYGDTNSSVPDYLMSKTVYVYDNFSENEEDSNRIYQTVITEYEDKGRLDSNHSVVSTWDGVAEQTKIRTIGFNYNDIGKLSTTGDNEQSNVIYNGDDGHQYKSSFNLYDTETSYFYDDAQRVIYINDDTNDLEGSTLEVLYDVNGRVESFTEILVDFNNQKLNDLKVHDSLFTFEYDGNKIDKMIFGGGSYVEFKYADFENEAYGFTPLFFFLPTVPDAEGRAIYNR